MLVLTRKTNQNIYINDNIILRIGSTSGNQVTIGIVAPKEIPVHRLEVYERNQLEKIEQVGDKESSVDIMNKLNCVRAVLPLNRIEKPAPTMTKIIVKRKRVKGENTL